MVREIEVKVLYNLPDVDQDKYFDVVTPPNVVEDKVYDEVIDLFCQDEGFEGLAVRCDDWFNLSPDEYHRKQLYVGTAPEQMAPWEP